ncbi:Lysophospholipase [Rhodopirellula islandica]|uniref:Lysophospholipase n=1 Tax=Rhodopirellula islandica TaxID=595434 RepID=A0A0J1BC60_RHOIS|nr:alpha/beta hydrolase [Rhodopirellula islandica]KLU04202.1 Lysophospholipase [Rhodopirellula islandica]
MAIEIEESTLSTPDGRQLHCRRSGPSSAEIAFVLVHGLGEHSGCYEDFAKRMSALDRGVVVYDQHGHGQSPGARGDAPSFDTLVDDIAVACEFAAQQFPRAELVLLGHSMGGNFVLNHLLGRDHEYVKRAIVTNPMILPPNPPTRPQAFAAWLTGKLIPHIRLSATIEPTQLTQDVEARRELADDDLIHEKLSIGIGSQLLSHGIWLTDHAKKLNVKLLVLTGADDELCDSDTTDEFIEKAGRFCHHVCFEGLRHSLLIEDEREQVYEAIETWLLDTAALSIE